MCRVSCLQKIKAADDVRHKRHKTCALNGIGQNEGDAIRISTETGEHVERADKK